jgi:hypothetical protein
MLGVLRAAGVIALFVLAPGLVVWAQIGFVQVIAKLGQIEADQGSFRSRRAGGETAVPDVPRKGELGSSPAIPAPMCRSRNG